MSEGGDNAMLLQPRQMCCDEAHELMAQVFAMGETGEIEDVAHGLFGR